MVHNQNGLAGYLMKEIQYCIANVAELWFTNILLMVTCGLTLCIFGLNEIKWYCTPCSLYVEISEVFSICGNSVLYRYHHPSVYHGPSHMVGIYVRNNYGMIVNPSNTLTLWRELFAAHTLIAFAIRTFSGIRGRWVPQRMLGNG